MYSRRLGVVLTLFLAATVSGCTVLDRESYSIVIRKKSHQYERSKLPPVAPEPAPDSPAHVRDDLDELIDVLEAPREAFRPFKYCRLHKSRHGIESVMAYALAPVDYPAALTSHISYIFITAAIRAALAPLVALFGPPDAPLKVEERRKPPTR
jgi:hypothetical protein